MLVTYTGDQTQVVLLHEMMIGVMNKSLETDKVLSDIAKDVLQDPELHHAFIHHEKNSELLHALNHSEKEGISFRNWRVFSKFTAGDLLKVMTLQMRLGQKTQSLY